MQFNVNYLFSTLSLALLVFVSSCLLTTFSMTLFKLNVLVLAFFNNSCLLAIYSAFNVGQQCI